jgi:hypothetical protein
MSSRRSALAIVVLGVAFLASPRYLAALAADSHPYVLAAIHGLVFLGMPLLAIGIYRLVRSPQ